MCPYLFVKLSCILVCVIIALRKHQSSSSSLALPYIYSNIWFSACARFAHGCFIKCHCMFWLQQTSNNKKALLKWMLLPKQFPWDNFNRFTSFFEYNNNLSHFLFFQSKLFLYILLSEWVSVCFSFEIRSLYSIRPIFDTLKI